MLLAVSLWVFGEALGIASVVAAMIGLSVLLLLGVLDWDDCLSEKSAWDTLTWFAVLVGMAGQLTNLGIVAWMSNSVAKSLQAFSLSWPVAFCVLQAAYFFIHYLFASQTGHVGALFSAFLAMHLASGVPGVLAALALAYNTNLFGALTHYSSGQAAVYYGVGYVELPDVFKLGFTMAAVNATIWGVKLSRQANDEGSLDTCQKGFEENLVMERVGYTAPEYAIHGQLSEKVDTYSFGVVVLEIISGQKTNDARREPAKQYLLEWAWNLYENDALIELVDEHLDRNEYTADEVKKVMAIALMCTQSAVASRPTMSEVVVLLLSKAELVHQLTRPIFVDATTRIHVEEASISDGSSPSDVAVSTPSSTSHSHV
ncbi:hypothetical protein ACLOJK_014039 [Asimina triloba]